MLAVVVVERMKAAVEALMEGSGLSLAVVEEVRLWRVFVLREAVGGVVSTSWKERAGLVVV